MASITKNSVWIAAKLKNLGRWPFRTDINRVEYKSFKPTPFQKECGAYVGGFFDVDSGAMLFGCFETLNELSKASLLRLENGYQFSNEFVVEVDRSNKLGKKK